MSQSYREQQKAKMIADLLKHGIVVDEVAYETDFMYQYQVNYTHVNLRTLLGKDYYQPKELGYTEEDMFIAYQKQGVTIESELYDMRYGQWLEVQQRSNRFED